MKKCAGWLLLLRCSGVLLLPGMSAFSLSPPADNTLWPTLNVASMGRRPISLGCEETGIYLDLVRTSSGFHVPHRLRLSQGGRAKINRYPNSTFRRWLSGHSALLTSLNQLRGLVKVTDGQ